MINLLFILTILCGVGFGTMTWSSCSTESKLNVTAMTVTPDPIVIGNNVTAQGKGTLNETVTSGQFMFNVSYYVPGLGWKVLPGFPMYWPLCNITSCPIPSGPYMMSESIFVPYLALPGKYAGNLLLTDQNNATVACITWQEQIVM